MTAPGPRTRYPNSLGDLARAKRLAAADREALLRMQPILRALVADLTLMKERLGKHPDWAFTFGHLVDAETHVHQLLDDCE